MHTTRYYRLRRTVRWAFWSAVTAVALTLNVVGWSEWLALNS